MPSFLFFQARAVSLPPPARAIPTVIERTPEHTDADSARSFDLLIFGAFPRPFSPVFLASSRGGTELFAIFPFSDPASTFNGHRPVAALRRRGRANEMLDPDCRVLFVLGQRFGEISSACFFAGACLDSKVDNFEHPCLPIPFFLQVLRAFDTSSGDKKEGKGFLSPLLPQAASILSLSSLKSRRKTLFESS